MHQHSQQTAGPQLKSEAGHRRLARRPQPPDGAAEILTLQRLAGNEAVSRALGGWQALPQSARSGNLPPVIEAALHTTSKPLDAQTQDEMGAKFGRDFSTVRLHTDTTAVESARAIHAKAYTVGLDIVFGPGRYQPETTGGRQLLAHELTHVVQQSRGGAPTTGESHYRAAEAEAAAARSQTGAATVSLGIAPGTVQAEEEESWYSAAGSWILGAIGGEFVDDPGFSQIAVDFVLSMIPYVDQVADARDLVAHIWRLGFRDEYTQVLRWIALVFTLVGLIPEVGSAIKSASKAALRFVGHNLGEAVKLLRKLMAHLPEMGSSMRGVRNYVIAHWDDWARLGRGAWSRLLAGGSRLVEAIMSQLQKVRRLPGLLLERGKRFLLDRLARLEKLSSEHLPKAFDTVKEKLTTFLDDLQESMGLRPALAGSPPGTHIPEPKKVEPLQMSSMGTGGGRGPRVEDLTGGPRTTSEAIDELEDTVTHGSRSYDPSERSYIAEAGTQMERGEVERWAARLGPEWKVMHSTAREPWINKLFPPRFGKPTGPDMVAVNRTKRQVMVGDVAPNPRSRVDVRAGTGAGPPARERGGVGAEVTRAGDEGTRPHIEKTLEDAQRIAGNLPADLRDYQIFAQEWYWEHGQALSRLIPIKP
jgi:hypothetical protein